MATNFWKGDKAQFLLNKLAFKGGAEINYLSADPTGTATDAPVDSIGIFGKKIYIKQDAGSTKKWLDTQVDLASLSTCIIKGGEITKGTGNTVTIQAGHGYVVDSYTDSDNPVITLVSWNTLTDQAVTNLATSSASYFYFDSAGALQQQVAAFSLEDYRDKIIIGFAVHPSGAIATVDDVQSDVHFIGNLSNQMADIAHAMGPVNLDGNVFSANGANVKINKSIGESYLLGANYATSKKNPNTVEQIAGVALTFLRNYADGVGGQTYVSSTDIDPNNYDDLDGTLATVQANKWTIQRIYLDPRTSRTVIRYGQAEYNNVSDAEGGIFAEVYEGNDELESVMLRGWLLVKQGATDLTNATQAKFIEADKFGTSTAGGSTSSTTTKQRAYDNSLEGEVVVDAVKGAEKTRNEVGDAYAGNLYEVTNNAGTIEYFSITKLITRAASISSIGTGANSESFGDGSLSGGAESLAVGKNANAGHTGSVAIGRFAGATNQYGVSLGYAANNGQSKSIAIGSSATPDKTNQLIIGSSVANITEAVIGNGPKSATPIGVKLKSTRGDGTDIAGSDIVVAGGEGTGTGVGGKVKVQTAPSGTTGTATNALVDRVIVDENVTVIDNDGTHVLRAESEVLYIEDFKKNDHSIFTDTANVVSSSNTTSTAIGKYRSMVVTVTTGVLGNGTLSPEVIVTDYMKEFGVVGLNSNTRFDGNLGDMEMYVEFFNGVDWTTLPTDSFNFRSGSNLNRFLIDLDDTCTKFRYTPRVVVAGSYVLEIGMIKLVSNPLPTAESVEVNSIQLEGNDGRAITGSTESIPFGTGTAGTTYKGWTYGADGSTGLTGNYYTVQKNNSVLQICGSIYHGNVSNTIFLHKNNVQYKRITPYIRSDVHSLTYISEIGEFAKGDKISLSSYATVTLVNTQVSHYLNIVETASSSNVVFEGVATDTEWTAYTPTFQGVTINSVSAWYRRVGGDLEVRGFVDGATDNASDFYVTLPSGLNLKTSVLRAQGEKLGSMNINRSTAQSINATAALVSHLFYHASDTDKLYGTSNFSNTGAVDVYTKQAANSFVGGGTDFSFDFKVPIEGWKVTDPLLSVPVTNLVENVYSARIANNGTASITSQSANAFSNPNRVSLGNITLDISNLGLTEAPSVVVTIGPEVSNAASLTAKVISVSATQVHIETSYSYSAAESLGDYPFHITIQRQGADYIAPKGNHLLKQPVTVATTDGVEYRVWDKTIDGKPVYGRKIIVTGSFTANTTLINFPITGEILKMRVIGLRSDNITFADIAAISPVYRHGTNVFDADIGGSTWTKLIGSIEYTK